MLVVLLASVRDGGEQPLKTRELLSFTTTLDPMISERNAEGSLPSPCDVPFSILACDDDFKRGEESLRFLGRVVG